MDETDLPTGFTWKRGYFSNQSQGQHHHQALAQHMEKRNSKIQCWLVEKTQNQYQQMVLTSKAVLPSTNTAMVSKLAFPLPLNITPATALNLATDARQQSQHDSLKLRNG